ncbi:MAG: FkbM family methyltransferase [Halioglobus sp.]|jgi:FkbM family methyltransferase
MTVATIKHSLKQVYTLLFGSFVAEREKEALRGKVMTLPITSEYPFDVEAKLLRSIGIERSVMLDIGANTGFYSAILEDVVGSENLYLFEPLPHLHRSLKQHFKKAHVFDFALSDKEGIQNIRIPFIDGKRFDTRATFNRHVEPNQTGFDEIEVRFFPLDTIAKNSQLGPIGFIKIDVEGHELEVLNGGTETITRFKPLILIEIESRHHKFPIEKIFSTLEALGYKGYYIDPEELELRHIARFVSDRDQNEEDLKSLNYIKYLNNFFFVHETLADDFIARTAAFLKSEKLLVE